MNLFLSVLDKSTATVSVNCNKGESINAALSKNTLVRSVTIEISGICSENVVVTRDRVTLRGTNPANDGIAAVENTDATDAALWVRGAHLITVENLKLTGGFNGLLATDVNLPSLILVNCRLEGNNAYGAQLENSLVQADNTVFNVNGNVDAGVFASSRFVCTGCTMTNPQGSGALGTIRLNVLALTANRVLLFNSTLTGGGINSDTTLLIATDTTIEGVVPNGLSLLASNHSLVNLTRVQVKGPMRFFQGSNAQLFGVTQMASAVPNQLDDSAFVRIADASPAAGGPPTIPSAIQGFMLRNFSKLTLLQTSQISGSLNCSIGADAFCSTPTNVSGISNCGLCPKP